MRIALFLPIICMLFPSMSGAANVVRQTMDIENSANPRMACQNPRFNFTRQEMEICLNVYQGCMRPELKQAEREQCIVDAVRKGKAAAGQAGGSKDAGGQAPGSQGAKGGNLDFSFTTYQAYDLIEICEQKQNKNRPLCSGSILPNKGRIISDINKARQ